MLQDERIADKWKIQSFPKVIQEALFQTPRVGGWVNGRAIESKKAIHGFGGSSSGGKFGSEKMTPIYKIMTLIKWCTESEHFSLVYLGNMLELEGSFLLTCCSH